VAPRISAATGRPTGRKRAAKGEPLDPLTALRVVVSEVESTSGRSRTSVGKRQRERQKSRQVTDLPRNRQVAGAAVSLAGERFAVQHGSGPLLGRRCSANSGRH